MYTTIETLLIFLIYLNFCQGQIATAEYKNLPALYKFDNYHECINRDQSEPYYPVKYCMVFVEIQADNDSVLWKEIESMRLNKFYYRHDHLFRGLCMDGCKDLLENNAPARSYEDRVLSNDETQMFQRFYKSTTDLLMRYQYRDKIAECVNREYQGNYNLSTKTFVNFCINPQESRPKDIYFGLTLLLIISLVLINIFSTVYDAKLKAEQLNPGVEDDYYIVKHKSKADRYLTAFSLYRNYKRLVMPIKGDIGSDLAFLDGFRAILSCIIVQEHVFLLQFFHIVNPEFIENFWHRPGPRLVFQALVWLELFFVLSGLLLYVKFEKSQYITTKSSFLDCLHVFLRLLFSRYLRYLPSLIFVTIFTANITYQQYNSLGRSIIDPNCSACRDSWWLNIFMINNYYIKYSCLQHTWYIAADFQLYSLFLIILIVMAKYPKTKVFVMVTVAVLAVFINFGLNYILKLESIFMLIPESYRYFYFKNITTAEHLYFSFYTNINSFLLGTVCGYIYMKYLRKSRKNKKLLGEILQNSPPFGWSAISGILYLGTRIMDHKETTIWTAGYGLLLRHVGLAIVAVIVVLRSMCNGGGVLKYAGFRLLSRISFQVYLWQIVVLLNICGQINHPINVNYITLTSFGVCFYIATNVIAFVVALFMEYPFNEVISIMDIERHRLVR